MIKCYRCSQLGHNSNECPRHKALVLEEDEETKNYSKPDKFDKHQSKMEEVEGDANEPLICIMKKVLFAQHPEWK